MTFFYDLNKRLADIEAKSEAKPLNESAVAEIAHDTGKKLLSKGERSDLAKQARAGKDIGHPGKKFKDVAAAAAKRYGSKEAGERVAAAAMFKGAAKKESATNEVWGGGDVAVMEKMADRDYDQDGKIESEKDEVLGSRIRAAKKAGRMKENQIVTPDEMIQGSLGGSEHDVKEGAYDPTLDAPRFTIKDRDILEKLMKVYHQDLYHLRSKSGAEGDVVYGTSPQLIQALQGLAQRMPGKVIAMEGAKPDFLDLDKDGNRTEPMKKAAQDRKQGVEEGRLDDLADRRGPKSEKASNVRTVAGRAYGGAAQKDEPEVDDDEEVAVKGRGRPKGPEREERKTGKGYKHKPAKNMKPGTKTSWMTPVTGVKEGDEPEMPGRKTFESPNEDMIATHDRGEYDLEGDMAKDQLHTIVRNAKQLEKILRDEENLPEWVQAKMAKIEGMMQTVANYMMTQHERDIEAQTGEEGVTIAEKAVSQQQQKFMGMVHAMQKGEKIKGASPELKKVAKTMKKSDVEDFAKTKHEGLPKKVAKKKEESVEETTTAGSVAPSADAPKSKGSKGMTYGKGIYDSLNREVEQMIAEAMDITVNQTTDDNGETHTNVTVNARDEDAFKLAQILQLAGMEHSHEETCDACGQAPCGCEQMDEAYAYGNTDETLNEPDWPTDKETTGADDEHLQRWSGGLDGPKSTGQTTIPVIASQEKRQHTYEDAELSRLLELAKVGEAEEQKPAPYKTSGYSPFKYTVTDASGKEIGVYGGTAGKDDVTAKSDPLAAGTLDKPGSTPSKDDEKKVQEATEQRLWDLYKKI